MRERLEACDDPVAVERIELTQISATPCFMGGYQGGARSTKEVENDVSPARNIPDRVCDHLDWLDGRMKGKLLETSRLE